MKHWLLLVVPVLASMAGCSALPPHAGTNSSTQPPNILLIVLDDFGYNDLGANGNTRINTPHLDALAAQGTLYTRHYAEATCSATRAALMTGTFPAVNGLRPNHLGLSEGTPTIASMLSQADYRTQHIGKWHIASATLEQSPSHYGFDDWFGFLHNNTLAGPSADGIHFPFPTYYNPWLQENQSPAEQHQGHLTNILTERAIDFLAQQKEQTKPWFLNLWYFAPHAPIQPAANFQKQYPATKEGAYHALIAQLDFNIGELMTALDQNGQADDTLVILLSDNGGTNSDTDNNYPFFGKKTQFFEGGVRTPMLMRWPGHVEAGAVSDELVSVYDIFPTIAQASSAAPPPELIGRSLLDPQRAAPAQLYWESSTSYAHSYSILSPDGRWRLTGYFGQQTLNDLQADPSGAKDVLASHPEVAAKLTDDYMAWRKTARLVDFSYEELNASGGAILRGNDLQRSPGYSGFTFAIGVTPSPDADGSPQVIVEQPGRWLLRTTKESSLKLEILDHVMELPALPAGRCSEIVISSQFTFTPIQPAWNKTTINVYLNGETVETLVKLHPTINTRDYANPTYIGVSAEGTGQFTGTLSRPIILNERVVPDAESNMIGNGISGVPSTCPDSSASRAGG